MGKLYHVSWMHEGRMHRKPMAKARTMTLSEDFTHKLLLLKQIRVRSATHGISLITACGGTSITLAKSLKNHIYPSSILSR